MRLLKILLIFLPLCIFLVFPVSGQNDTIDIAYKTHDTTGKQSGLFDTDELLELSLRFDISTFKRKKSNVDYLPALLTCYFNETDSINKDVSIRARGQRRLEICSFPPVRINFKKSDSRNDEFAKIDKIKVVTHCEPGHQNFTLKEYLIYKLFNVLTDCSYKVRLAKINYINTAKNSKPVIEYAFFIEPTDMLAKRLKGTEVKIGRVTQRNIKPGVMDRTAIFNYMIGNTDWSVPIFHNVTIFSLNQSENPPLGLIVPYDFDYSGLINADYAVPFEGLNIKSVLDRRYLGVCRSEDEYSKVLKEFADKKEELYKVINDFPYLNAREKKEMITYLSGFLKYVDKPKSILYRLTNECIKI